MLRHKPVYRPRAWMALPAVLFWLIVAWYLLSD